jgi:glycosyltransferase involved in cell wall biosynthesis
VSAGLVSVIVPFRNAERFLGEAIESVLAQSYENWELLLVDDGSTDKGPDIVRRRARERPDRIMLLGHPDGRSLGAAATRNLGIAQARGDYVAFLDADDVWAAGKLLEQTEALASFREVGMVYGVSRWWYSWTGDREDAERDHVEPLGIRAGTPLPPRALLGPFFAQQSAAIPNPTNLLVRRSVIDMVGNFEEAVPNGYEDQAFCAKVVTHHRVLPLDRCWDRYRQHPDSLTARVASNGGAFAARAEFLAWLIDYLGAEGVDPRLNRALRRQRLVYAHPRVSRLLGRLRDA